MAIALNHKSSAKQLAEIAGKDTAVDLVLACHPNAGKRLLTLLSNHVDKNVQRKAIRHPSTPVKTLVRLGPTFPNDLFNNPAFPDLLAHGKEFAAMFEPKSLEKILEHKKCPDALGKWALKYGDDNHQAAYLCSGERSDQMALLFYKSRYHRIISGVIEDYDVAFVAWAKELGWVPVPSSDDEYDLSERDPIDYWVETFFDELWNKYVPSKGACTVLQGELVRYVGRLEGELYKNGMCNMWKGGMYYRWVDMIKETVLKDGKFSPKVQKL